MADKVVSSNTKKFALDSWQSSRSHKLCTEASQKQISTTSFSHRFVQTFQKFLACMIADKIFAFLSGATTEQVFPFLPIKDLNKPGLKPIRGK